MTVTVTFKLFGCINLATAPTPTRLVLDDNHHLGRLRGKLSHLALYHKNSALSPTTCATLACHAHANLIPPTRNHCHIRYSIVTAGMTVVVLRKILFIPSDRSQTKPTADCKIETFPMVSNEFLVVIRYKNPLKTVGPVPIILQSAVCRNSNFTD